jgi:septal ring factor EnvC (AmiA/AmiB activator)
MINNPNAYNKDGTPRILNTIPYINKLLFKKIPSIDDIKELINHTARSVVEDFHIGHVWEDGDYVINWRMHKVHLAIEAFNSKQYHEAYCQIIKFWANDFDGSETDMADKYRFPHYIENADCEMTEEEFTTCTNRWFIYKPNHSKILEERDAVDGIKRTITTLNGIDNQLIASVSSLSSLSVNYGTLSTTVAGMDTSISSLTNTIAATNTTVVGIQTRLDNNEISLASALSTLTTISGFSGTQATAITNLQTSMTGVTNTLSQVTQSITVLTTADTAKTSSINQLVSRVNSNDISISSITQTLQTVNNQSQASADSLTTLTANFNGVSTTVSQHTSAISTLDTQRAAMQQTLNTTGASLTTIGGAVTTLEGKNEAYLSITGTAAGNRAQVTLYANNSGAGVDIVGDVRISGAVTIDGTLTAAKFVAKGITDTIYSVNGGYIYGNYDWQVLISQTIVMGLPGTIIPRADLQMAHDNVLWNFRLSVSNGTTTNQLQAGTVNKDNYLSTTGSMAVPVGTYTVLVEFNGPPAVFANPGAIGLTTTRTYV